MDTIRTCLWFNKIALDAVEFYVEIFPNSKIGKISYYDDSNPYSSKYNTYCDIQ